MERNYQNCASAQTAHSIELKFRQCIIGHCPAFYISFVKFGIKSYFTEVKFFFKCMSDLNKHMDL